MMPRFHPLAALIMVSGLPACQDVPSVGLHWVVQDANPAVVGPQGVGVCSRTGLFEVRARTYSGPDQLVDERFYPCFPAAFEEGLSVPGPSVPPGRYAIELRGVDRTSTPWDGPPSGLDPSSPAMNLQGCHPLNDIVGCRDDQLVCDCKIFVVDAPGDTTAQQEGTIVTRQGQTARDAVEFTLTPPGECIDTIDNDRDGFTDQQDLACSSPMSNGTETQSTDIADLSIRVSLLGNNPAATCSSIAQFRGIRVQQLTGRPDSDTPGPAFEGPCNLETPYRVAFPVVPGPFRVSVVGIDNNGEESTTPFVIEQTVGGNGGFFAEQVDFGPEDFLDPIVGRIRIILGYQGSQGLSAGEPVGARRSCAAPMAQGQGSLAIASLRLQLLNAHGGSIDAPVLIDGEDLFDGTPQECSNEIIQSQPVEWSGGYGLRAEALSAEGEICFRADNAPMAPGILNSIALTRVFDHNGAIPASCADCAQDDDCGSADARCLDSVCQFPCERSSDCRANGNDDSDFVCAVVGQSSDGEELRYCTHASAPTGR